MVTKISTLAPFAALLLLIGGMTTIGSCVSVTPRSATIEVGETIQLEASGNRDNTFDWDSSNADVATVSATGLVTGISEGTAIITATGTNTGRSARAMIRVEGGAGPTVEITPSTGTVEVGDTFDFNATSTDPTDTAFDWESDDETVATVDENGTVTGVAAGEAIITATGVYSNASDTATITVTEALAEVTIEAPSTTVEIGATLQLTAQSTDPLDTSFDWTADPETVATVDDTGLVTGVAVGTVTITATGVNSGATDNVQLTVNEPGNQLPTANPGENQTVGTNLLVTLDASASTDPDEDPLTFAWVQVSGPTVTLSDPTAEQPTFTPPQPGIYVFELVVSDPTGPSQPAQVTITVENTAPTVSIQIEGVSETDILNRGLDHPESSGLTTVGLETHVLLVAEVTDPNGDEIDSLQWAVTVAPSGSQATLSDPTAATTLLIPDLPGEYEVALVATDVPGASTTVAQVINAATYVGAGIVSATDPPAISASACTGCHNGTTAPNPFPEWLLTAHATAFRQYIDGAADAPASCLEDSILKFLTTGYNVYAENDGFDDLLTIAGITLPAPAAGNYATLVQAQPELMQLANVQCESCHGPASLHAQGGFAFNVENRGISVSLASDTCGQCHKQEQEWEVSPHADATSEAFTYPIGPTRSACVKCHSGVGFIDFAEGETTLRTDFQTHTCAVCHDPHDATNEAQLRLVGTAQLPGDTELTEVGASATCMTCHNGRRGPADALSNGFPHYSTASENLMGVNAVDYGTYNFPDSPHPLVVQNLCVTCHMAPTPGDECEPDVVGGHTFAVVSDNDTPENPADDVTNVTNACSACHGAITSINLTADGDYDGDGATEGVQDEVQGLLDVLLAELEASGVEHISHHPYWANVTTDAQRQAIFNYELVNHDGSLGVHNTKFSVSVLQATYREFAGEDVPGVEPGDILYTLQGS